MKKLPTLMILAAGMSSRFGSLKQLAGFGPNGESLIDYTLYDAIQIGYKKIVFIIREELKEAFMERFDSYLDSGIEIIYVSQNKNDLPSGLHMLNREKPWGTAHAVWAARYVVNEPFVIVNADDYYGYKALDELFHFTHEDTTNDYAVMTYYLGNTLSENGGVNRGICFSDGDGYLANIEECYNISYQEDTFTPSHCLHSKINHGTLVSMNMFLLQPSFFDHCEDAITVFIQDHGKEEKREVVLTNVLDDLLIKNKIKIRTLNTNDKWIGVTFPEDKYKVKSLIQSLVREGRYPNKLSFTLDKSA